MTKYITALALLAFLPVFAQEDIATTKPLEDLPKAEATADKQDEILKELRSIKRDMITLKAEMDAMNRRLSLVLAEQEGTATSFEDLLHENPELAMEKLISLFENNKFESVFNRGIEFSTTIPKHEKAATAYLLAEMAFLRVNKGDYEKTMAWREENGDRLYAVFRDRAANNLLSEKEIKATLFGHNRHEVKAITGLDNHETFTLGQFNLQLEYDNGRVDSIQVEPIATDHEAK